VAVIGSGPSGLSCAYFLAKAGYKVTVFEAARQIGGLLRLGIPEYRLPEAILDWEIEKLRSLNIKFQPRLQFGKNLRLADLKDFNALFMAVGFQKSHPLGIGGETSPGVLTALDFLKKVNSGHAVRLGKKVAVIGGGNAAIDAARSARRLGCKPVILYRRTGDEMPAFPDEREELKREGIEFFPLVIPKRIIVQEGQTRKIECLRSRLGEVGRDGRRMPVPVPNSKFTLDIDNVILAVGALPDFSGFPASLKFKKTGLFVDSYGATTRNGIFAGGDIATGAGTVSEALASGKKGAMTIQRFLKKEAAKRNGSQPEEVSFAELNPDYFYPAQKISPSHLDSVAAVESFAEVRLGCTEEEAQREAQRCFGCAAPPHYNAEYCRGCTNCEQRCPASAITIERLERPVWVGVDPGEFNAKEILQICTRARMHPQQTVCYCTNTTAGEIAAAILKGASSPEAISRMTGVRTGCTVLCIQSILKLLESSGQTLTPTPTHQYYARTITLWEVDETTKRKYEAQGYRFEEDRELLEAVYKRQ
jgi:NADPH-dependent glutamate synthase beta subunit-like oxidoreductase/bacterioferritin-associated ferredoxin